MQDMILDVMNFCCQKNRFCFNEEDKRREIKLYTWPVDRTNKSPCNTCSTFPETRSHKRQVQIFLTQHHTSGPSAFPNSYAVMAKQFQSHPDISWSRCRFWGPGHEAHRCIVSDDFEEDISCVMTEEVEETESHILTPPSPSLTIAVEKSCTSRT
jgi:hypothetical protein